ncbi:hypothetical protein RclHR1_23820002 [Rhizophagus clarus]|uniref:DDE-1 domain-containing protein n=1 Tax=Rhizophagus clarus TaxID=94130 RepID=A0A2Z6RA50_9GLOM|nr:hypothetical protein RclHR1_23820002 [Rhizophagus clarus]
MALRPNYGITKNHRKNKLNIKEAIDYIANAWSNVTQTTIQNCWIKTGILPSGNIEDVDVNNNSDNINSDLSELESLLDDTEDSDNLLEYFQMLDKEISTEEILTDEQIIKYDESEKDKDDDDDDDDDDVIPLVPAKNAVDSLKIFIDYFEQQVDDNFNFNDLQIFKKRL